MIHNRVKVCGNVTSLHRNLLIIHSFTLIQLELQLFIFKHFELKVIKLECIQSYSPNF